mmetsp:Transcript_5153/g.8033  ORF Transcript_5153/g.8033 Transcript_5153/m.8033 type:complete len:147 (-) Transcript_5153:1-441(-)
MSNSRLYQGVGVGSIVPTAARTTGDEAAECATTASKRRRLVVELSSPPGEGEAAAVRRTTRAAGPGTRFVAIEKPVPCLRGARTGRRAERKPSVFFAVAMGLAVMPWSIADAMSPHTYCERSKESECRAPRDCVYLESTVCKNGWS